mmetsp:Transcript_18262/g.50088  ORF Transcript_18262/g.50088 Transcript_18262/m.50088 type:complete len:254 (+) Transcript_18262:101-862(+)
MMTTQTLRESGVHWHRSGPVPPSQKSVVFSAPPAPSAGATACNSAEASAASSSAAARTAEASFNAERALVATSLRLSRSIALVSFTKRSLLRTCRSAANRAPRDLAARCMDVLSRRSATSAVKVTSSCPMFLPPCLTSSRSCASSWVAGPASSPNVSVDSALWEVLSATAPRNAAGTCCAESTGAWSAEAALAWGMPQAAIVSGAWCPSVRASSFADIGEATSPPSPPLSSEEWRRRPTKAPLEAWRTAPPAC